jgi:hypothetical protein
MQLSVSLETFSLEVDKLATLLRDLTTLKEMRIDLVWSWLTLETVRTNRYAVDQE